MLELYLPYLPFELRQLIAQYAGLELPVDSTIAKFAVNPINIWHLLVLTIKIDDEDKFAIIMAIDSLKNVFDHGDEKDKLIDMCINFRAVKCFGYLKTTLKWVVGAEFTRKYAESGQLEKLELATMWGFVKSHHACIDACIKGQYQTLTYCLEHGYARDPNSYLLVDDGRKLPNLLDCIRSGKVDHIRCLFLYKQKCDINNDMIDLAIEYSQINVILLFQEYGIRLNGVQKRFARRKLSKDQFKLIL